MRSRRLLSASVPIADSTGSIVENAFHKGKPIKSFGREIHLMHNLVGCEGFVNLLNSYSTGPKANPRPCVNLKNVLTPYLHHHTPYTNQTSYNKLWKACAKQESIPYLVCGA